MTVVQPLGRTGNAHSRYYVAPRPEDRGTNRGHARGSLLAARGITTLADLG